MSIFLVVLMCLVATWFANLLIAAALGVEDVAVAATSVTIIMAAVVGLGTLFFYAAVFIGGPS